MKLLTRATPAAPFPVTKTAKHKPNTEAYQVLLDWRSLCLSLGSAEGPGHQLLDQCSISLVARERFSRGQKGCSPSLTGVCYIWDAFGENKAGEGLDLNHTPSSALANSGADAQRCGPYLLPGHSWGIWGALSEWGKLEKPSFINLTWAASSFIPTPSPPWQTLPFSVLDINPGRTQNHSHFATITFHHLFIQLTYLATVTLQN